MLGCEDPGTPAEPGADTGASGADAGHDAVSDSSPEDAGIDSPPPEISSELVPIPEPTSSVGPEQKRYPAIALGAETLLLAWADNRSDPLAAIGSDIYLARYSPDGTLLDSIGRVAADTREHEIAPRIAFGGGVFLVAWWAITRPPNGSGATGLVRAIRMSPAGELLDPNALELGVNTSSPQVTFVGDRFFVVFGGNSISTLRLVPVFPDGSVGASQQLVANDAYSPRIASYGARALLSYQHESSVTDRSVRMMLLDSGSNILKQHSWPTYTGYNTETAGGPTGFGIAYYDHWTGGMHVRRLDPDADWIDPAPIPVPTGGYPVIARAGNGYLMAYASPSLTSVRIEDGAAAPSTPLAVGPTESTQEPVLVVGGSSRAIAWERIEEGVPDVAHTRLDATGVAADPQPTPAPRAQSASQVAPALGSIAGKSMLAFCSLGRDARSVRHALLDADGATISASVGEIPDACHPQIASGPAATLLVWQSASIRSALVAVDGSLGQSVEIASGSSNQYESWAVDDPRVAATPDGFVVTYHLFGGDTQQSLLEAAVLNAAGAKQSSTLIASGSVAFPIAVADTTLIVWTEAGDSHAGRVLAKRLSDTGVSPTELGKSAGGQPLGVVSDGSVALVAWVDEESRRILGALLAADGSIAKGPFPISPSGHDALAPNAVFDGQRFVVAWRDLRTHWADLYAARVDTSGVVLDADAVAISAEPGNELEAALSAAAPGNLWFAYGRLDSAVGATRMRLRRAVFPAP